MGKVGKRPGPMIGLVSNILTFALERGFPANAGFDIEKPSQIDPSGRMGLFRSRLGT